MGRAHLSLRTEYANLQPGRGAPTRNAANILVATMVRNQLLRRNLWVIQRLDNAVESALGDPGVNTLPWHELLLLANELPCFRIAYQRESTL